MTQDFSSPQDPQLAVAIGGALLAADTLAVMVLDASFTIVGTNDAARTLTRGDAAPGIALAAAFDTSDVDKIRAWASGATESSSPFLLRNASDSGADRALLAWVARSAEGAGYVLLGRTAAADLEREARILRARRWEIVGQLTSGVAHDLNNRLSTVTTFSDLMLGDAEPGSQDAEDLKEIKEAGLESATITRKLDLFAGGYVGDRGKSTFAEVVTGFEKLIRRFVGKHIAMVLELEEDAPMVAAPPIRLEEILIALVANARDAMAEGGTLTLRTGPGDDLGRPGAVLEVCDTGPGDDLPPLERALEPFFSSKPWELGSGLGLTTVGGIVHDLGGSVTMSRQPGAGTTVRVVLPEHEAASEAEETGAQETDHNDPAHVALIEPSDGTRSALERGLGRYGIRVSAATSLDQVDADAFAYDAALADVPDRPGAGDAVVESIRRRIGDVPVVLLRRRAGPRATAPGTTRVLELAKPTDLATIRRALTDVRRGPASAVDGTAP